MAVAASGRSCTGRVLVLGPLAWAQAVAAVLAEDGDLLTTCDLSLDAPPDVVVVIDAPGTRREHEIPQATRTLLLTDAAEHAGRRRCDAVLGTGCSVPDLVRTVRALVAGEHLRPVPLRRRHELTEREAGVLALVAEGCSDHDIAAELGVSVNTVRTHLQRTRVKVGARNRLHLMAMARRGGFDEGAW